MDLPTQLAVKAAMKIMRAINMGAVPGVDDIAATIDRETKLPQWKAALEGLTPSGSEFVDDPETCRRFVKDRLDSDHRMLMDSLRRRKAIEAALANIAGEVEEDGTVLLPCQLDMANIAREALGMPEIPDSKVTP